MRVVITGGDGFVGRWMCRAMLSEGAWISAWVRRMPATPLAGINYRVQDIRDAAGCRTSMREDAPHQVFHLAAITHLGQAQAEPGLAHDTNVRGTANVMAAVPKEAKAVHASTCHVYGRPQHLPIDEAHPCQPIGTYAQTKLESEQAAKDECSAVVIARAFHHTGAGQSHRYALSDWARQASLGQTVQAGDLSLRRDYADVRDIVAGYQLLAKSGTAHDTYNLCTGTAPTLEALLLGLGRPGEVTYRQVQSRFRADDVREFRGDPSKAEALGWKRQFSQQQMLWDLVAAAG